MSGSSLTVEEFEEAVAEAERAGFQVVRADSRTLLLDLDSPTAVEQFERVLPLVDEKYGVVSTQRWKSKSGNTHASVSLADGVGPCERYLLQAALGSDGVREVLNALQLTNGVPEPCVLFVPTARSGS